METFGIVVTACRALVSFLISKYLKTSGARDRTEVTALIEDKMKILAMRAIIVKIFTEDSGALEFLKKKGYISIMQDRSGQTLQKTLKNTVV